MKIARKYHIILMICWIGLGLFVIFASYRLGLGGLRNPGPGLMPFLLGMLLCLTALYMLIAFIWKKMDQGAAVVREMQDHTNYTKLGLVLVSLFAYSLVLEWLGFLITTFTTLFILFRIMNNRWFTVVLASVLTVAVSYGLFTYLGVNFPKGILRGL
jgi:putative tricarboxylic transport membrane protein